MEDMIEEVIRIGLLTLWCTWMISGAVCFGYFTEREPTKVYVEPSCGMFIPVVNTFIAVRCICTLMKDAYVWLKNRRRN